MTRTLSTPSAISIIPILLAVGSILSCNDRQEDLAQFMEREKTLYTHGQEEELIRYFFRDRRDGVYVDIGCFDYKWTSTTYYLEEHLNWSGIGVDAEDSYRAGWEKHRPRSKFFAYAVSDKSGETITFFQAGAVAATELDRKNLDMWQEKRGIPTREVTVPTITIDDLLDREGVKEIDFLSIDINGAEPIALAGFDIKRFAPELVHVEANPHRREELLAYFEKNDYVRIDAFLEFDRANWYFTPSE